MAAFVSRSGSTETNQALTRSASLPIARSTSEISNSEVGHTSGQWVKPKKISVGRPCIFFSVTVWPAWSVSWNGPPIAAGAATFRNPPSAHSISIRPTTRLPANAATMTSGRAVRSIMKFPCVGSEAGGDAGRNHLEEDRRPVMKPKPQRREQDGDADSHADDHDRRRYPARRRQYRRHV